MNEVNVILTTGDALMFKSFQKHYDLFCKLEDKGVFDIQFGKCVLNIAFGEIQNIVKEEVVWRQPAERRENR